MDARTVISIYSIHSTHQGNLGVPNLELDL